MARHVATLIAGACALVWTTAATPALARPDTSRGDRWMSDLQSAIAGDLAAGKPLVVHVHVPLCDNDIIRCGNARLGDGDDPDRNLYWATSGGFRGWFNRRGSGWKQVLVDRRDKGPILEVRVWRRRFRARGGLASAKKAFDAYVVATAWRGSEIRRAMDTYTRHLYGGDVETITAGGVKLAAGGGAHVVAYVGHNGWMDVDRYDFAAIGKRARTSSKRIKGTIAVACVTEDYLSPQVSSARRVPLLLTRWLLFAGAHAFEGAVTALAEGRDLAGVRRAAVRNYARGQGKTFGRVSGGFTNPSDRRWKDR